MPNRALKQNLQQYIFLVLTEIFANPPFQTIKLGMQLEGFPSTLKLRKVLQQTKYNPAQVTHRQLTVWSPRRCNI